MGHLSKADVLKILNLSSSILRNNPELGFCKVCIESKQEQKFIWKPVSRTTQPFELIHSDLCGPINPPSHSGKRYFIVYIDEYSRTAFTYFLHTKTATEIVSVFQEFLSRVEAMLPAVKFSRFRCDNARGEYDNSLIRGILRVSGISFEPSPAYSQHKHGVSERMIRTLATKARSMLLDSQLEMEFWAEAISTVAYLHGRSPSQTRNGITPFETLWQRKPVLDHLRRFGCAAYRLIPKDQSAGKFASRSRECVMIGYVHSSTTIWKLWDRSRKSLVHSSDVIFHESTVLGAQVPHNSETDKRLEIFSSCFPDDLISHATYNDGDGDVSYELVPVPVEEQLERALSPISSSPKNDLMVASVPTEPRSPSPAATQRQNLRRSLRNRIARPILQATAAQSTEVVREPPSYQDALEHTHSEHWRSAMRSEFSSLMENGTWEYVDRSTVPSHKAILGCRWVYRLKVNPDRTMRFKARLVIKGYQQVEGVDFDSTFAPVAKLISFRLLTAIAAYYNWPIEQMDVVTAFLNPLVTDELYMAIPEGVEWLNPTHIEGLAVQTRVCKLRKALYRLKQAPRLWYQDIDQFLHSHDMLQSDSDSNLYYSPTSKLLSLLYVDDILLTAPTLGIVEEMKNKFKNHYQMSDLGPAKRYLGIEIVRHEDYVAIHQQFFIQDLLKRNKMEYCKGVSTPLEKNTCLSWPQYSGNSSSHALSHTSISLSLSTAAYQSLVGSLQWLMMATRPDLAYTASTLGQFNSQPTTESVQAAKRVLRYLQSISDYALHFPTKQFYLQNRSSKQSLASPSAEPIIERPIGYTDSDWAGDKVDRKSTYGYVFTLFATAVS